MGERKLITIEHVVRVFDKAAVVTEKSSSPALLKKGKYLEIWVKFRIGTVLSKGFLKTVEIVPEIVGWGVEGMR